MEENKEREYVSFSELYTFFTCPYKHYKNYVERVERVDNKYSIFGNLLHEAIDKTKSTNQNYHWVGMIKGIYRWMRKNEPTENPRMWARSALRIYREVFGWLDQQWPGHELVGSEIKLYEPIEGSLKSFYGYIDLVIRDKQGIYHIIDFKTCSWGWDKTKRSNTHKLYQVVLYKFFFCKKFNVEPEKVQTHYLLLKRTPSKNDISAIELFSITSGNKKMENAVEWLHSNMKNIGRGIRIKKKTTCDFCICK